MTRDQMIEILESDDIQYIRKGGVGGVELLSTILRTGFVGYEQFTDSELLAEMQERDFVHEGNLNDPHADE